MMILSITYLFPVGEVRRLKKGGGDRKANRETRPITNTHTQKFDKFMALISVTI